MSDLKIALLGTPKLDHLDHQLLFPDRKTLALLAYLATEGGMHKRQKLTGLLWPRVIGHTGELHYALLCITYAVFSKRGRLLNTNRTSLSHVTHSASM